MLACSTLPPLIMLVKPMLDIWEMACPDRLPERQ